MDLFDYLASKKFTYIFLTSNQVKQFCFLKIDTKIGLDTYSTNIKRFLESVLRCASNFLCFPKIKKSQPVLPWFIWETNFKDFFLPTSNVTIDDAVHWIFTQVTLDLSFNFLFHAQKWLEEQLLGHGQFSHVQQEYKKPSKNRQRYFWHALLMIIGKSFVFFSTRICI